MKNALFSAAVLVALASPSFAAAEVSCEDSLKTLRDTMQAVKVGDADMQKVKDLEAKGVERCNADDDKRASTFFADAMKILGH
jgi:hypothetical protein